jgi:hypothetical protein
MNTYSKYFPNVFLAKCTEKHDKGETIMVTTKYGKENECIVYNLIIERDGFYYYSIVRADGYNAQEYAKNKANKLQGYSENAALKSEQYYEKSHSITDNIPLGQPILLVTTAKPDTGEILKNHGMPWVKVYRNLIRQKATKREQVIGRKEQIQLIYQCPRVSNFII